MERVGHKYYNKDTGGKNRKFARGKWVRVATGATTGSGGHILMQGQFNVDIPAGVNYLVVRFVRVYPNGKRDGTGDCHLYVGHRKGKTFQHTWQHGVQNFGGKVDVEMWMPGTGKFNVRYFYLKVFK